MKKATQLARLLSIAFLLLLLAALIIAVISWMRLPRHGGQTIGRWFARADQQFSGRFSHEEIKAIELAFETMGTNALPFLLEKLTYTLSQNDLRRRELLSSLQMKRWIPQPIKDLLPNPFSGNEQNTAQQLLESMARKGIFDQPQLEKILLRPGPLGGYLDYQVLRLFERTGEKASNSAPVIARCFTSTNSGILASGLMAFVAITPSNSPHATLLRDALSAGNLRAASALPHFPKWSIPIEPFLPTLGEELCSTNSATHAEAMFALKRLKLHQQVLLPYFSKAITDPDPRFRAELLKELRTLGPTAADATPHVLAALDDTYSYVRAEAIQTLHAIHPSLRSNSELFPILKSKLDDPVEYVRDTAQKALA
jgi:hypothetical protein